MNFKLKYLMRKYFSYLSTYLKTFRRTESVFIRDANDTANKTLVKCVEKLAGKISTG